MFPAMRPEDFIAKWLPSEFGEKQASQEMFLDICRLVGHPTPGGFGDSQVFTFEKWVPGGFADAYLEERFGWEFKGSDADLDGAMNQLLRYQVHLKTPPLLIVSSFRTIIIRTNFPGRETVLYEIPVAELVQQGGVGVIESPSAAAAHLVGSSGGIVAADYLGDAAQCPQSGLQSLLQGQEGLTGSNLHVAPPRQGVAVGEVNLLMCRSTASAPGCPAGSGDAGPQA